MLASTTIRGKGAILKDVAAFVKFRVRAATVKVDRVRTSMVVIGPASPGFLKSPESLSIADPLIGDFDSRDRKDSLVSRTLSREIKCLGSHQRIHETGPWNPGFMNR
jgi:hypothetical protein